MPSPQQSDKLHRFAAAVRGSPHNLVSRSACEELEARHLPECIALGRLLPTIARTQRLLDVGSGGGFPGIVISIVRPDLQVTLLESRGKKTEFLRSVAADLDLEIEVIRGRAEEVARTDRAGSFDLVTARAVAPLPRLLPLTLPFLVPGGLLYAVKGEHWREELEEAASTLRRLRGRVVATPADLDRAESQAPRTVIVSRDTTA